MRTRSAVAPALVVLLVFAGWVKASPALAWVPVDLTVLGMALVGVLAIARWISIRFRLPSKALPLLIIIVAFTVPISYSDSSSGAGAKVLLLTGITLPAMFAAAILFADRPEDGWWLIRWTAVGGLLVGVLLQIAPAANFYGRYALEGGNTIGFGRATGAGIVAIWLLLLSGKVRWYVGLPAITVLVGLLFGSGSRGPLLAVAVSVLAVAIAQPGTRRIKQLLIVGAGGAIIGTWALSGASALAAGRILMLFSDDRGNSVGVRQALINRAVEVIGRNPVGLGWDGLAPRLEPLARHPHNIVLEVFAEAGWVPGLVFIAVLCVTLGRAFTGDPLSVAVGAMVVFWLVNALVSGDVNDNRALFIYLGAALVLATKASSRAVRPGSEEAKCPIGDGGGWTRLEGGPARL